MNARGSSALANRAGGGLWQRGHDDGVGGGAPARRCTALGLTELDQRALLDAVGCWGAGGAAVVTKRRLGASLPGLWRRRSYGSSTAAAAVLAQAKEAEMRKRSCG